MSVITPFHCWTEYWKAKEIVDQVYDEASIKDSHFLVCETSKLIDRILDWEKKQLPPEIPVLPPEQYMSAILKAYPHAIAIHRGTGWAIVDALDSFAELGFAKLPEDALRDAYKNLKEKGDI